MPSGTITIKAAPTKSPAPYIEIKFINLFEVFILVGKKPNKKVDTNMKSANKITYKL